MNNFTDRTEYGCFTGHRDIPVALYQSVSDTVADTVRSLYDKGIRHYYAGGALGFDLIASITVLNMKPSFGELKLTLALPCRDHDIKWREADRQLFRRVISRADRVLYVSESYYSGCMYKRNRYMVDRSSVCIAYVNRNTGGSSSTVEYAAKNGVTVINLAKSPHE